MTQGACPSCGAPVVFSAGSAQVLVCGSCSAVVARKGLSLEAHGRVGRVLDTDSPLRLGLEGRHQDRPFRIVGRLQKDQGAALWDEWYVEFEDGRTGWLSESEGALHLLFFAGEQQGVARRGLRPTAVRVLQGVRFVAEEVGEARTVSAEGQLPHDVDTSAPSRFVDLTGPGGALATLDWGASGEDAPELYVGTRVELEQLGFDAEQLRPRVTKVSLQAARCTQCNGPLELRAPDRALRVACPYCGALLDVSRGKLAFLQLLDKPDHGPRIPLGRKGTLGGVEWMVVGFLLRSCTVEGTRYPWDEYLLYHPRRGFSWLVDSAGHWQHLTPIPAGDLDVQARRSARYRGRRYRVFSSVEAVTETVLGEFYWEVEAGERARATEFVDPPRSISEDLTEDEVTYSYGEYLTPGQLQQAFALEGRLPRPQGYVGSQPNPHREGLAALWKWTGVWLALLLAVVVGLHLTSREAQVVDADVSTVPGAAPGGPEAMGLLGPFELARDAAVRVELQAALDNAWLRVHGDLVHEESGEAWTFDSELASPRGQVEGERWDEGSSRATHTFWKLPAGRYTLRTTAGWAPGRSDQVHAYHVRVCTGVPRTRGWLCALVVLLALPIVRMVRATTFETHRWAESNV